MPETTSTICERQNRLSEQIDELSKRLILDGVTAFRSADFERISATATAQGSDGVACAAEALARHFALEPNSSSSELAATLSAGLLQLQSLLKELDNSERAQVIAPQITLECPPHLQQTSTGVNSLAADEDLVREFVTESIEHLSSIENLTLILEKDSHATENLHAIFRAFHTIKGLAGFLEFADILSLTHEVETLLDRARNSQLQVTPAVVDIVLESTDVVRHELRGIELRLAGKVPPPTRVDEELLRRIRSASKGETILAVQVMEHFLTSESVRAPSHPQTLRSEAITMPFGKTAPATARPLDSTSLRIETAKLDQLMDMVGEMVIAQTLIGHSPALSGIQDPRLQRDMTQLARITANVQRIATGMRMVPIGNQFQKTARLVRDLSRRVHKLIVLDTIGEDTELDKTIAEELSDPLLHMVRNSIDHGIETPAERVALGKDSTAHIRIAAYHKSGQIVVEISDDGRGLNRERILARAQQNGLIHSSSQLSDNEILQLIFEPGFSTAEKVTDISGRGVGMDVVRKHVQKLRGRIDIHSTPGEGTTFFLRPPLTLAIIEGLVVVVGDQRYIVPIFSVKKMFRPTPEILATVQGKGEMVLVHGTVMPIVRLHRRFNIEPRSANLSEGILVVAESQGKQFCLFVDDLIGKQEVVIKSLGHNFKNIVGIAGCAILGDGRVGLILDVDGICKGKV